MKKLLFIPFLALIASCSEKASEAEMPTALNFSYTLDTVMVDAGDGFVFLNRLLATAALSPDQKTLFNFNPGEVELEVIDLVDLRVRERIKLESEGPLGVGNPSSLSVAQDGGFAFINFFDARLFNPALDSMGLLHIRREQFEGLGLNESLNPTISVSTDGEQLFVPYGPEDESLPQLGLAVVSIADKALRKIPLDIYARLQPYVMSLLQEGQVQMRTIEPVYFKQIEDRLLISSASLNELYILDLETDSVSHRVYQSTITQNSKKVPERTTMDSPEEMRTRFRAINEDVTFGDFYFDDQKKRYWRFSQELDRMIGDSATFKRVVTLFDEDLQQIHEEELPIDLFSFKFFKDGKLYSHINVEDELGFVVYTFDLN